MTGRAVVGAVIGSGAALLGALFIEPGQRDAPITVFLVLAIALVGLLLGTGAAAYGFIAGAVTVVAILILRPPPGSLDAADSLRLAAFVIGSPVVVLLVYRTELARDASSTAHQLAEEKRQALEVARRDRDAALERAEQDRARLEEVAEAIPEALIVYDRTLRFTYGNRAAKRLFGPGLAGSNGHDWGRLVDPRDEAGKPLSADEWPPATAQNGPYTRRLTVSAPGVGHDVMVSVEGTPIPGGGCVLLLRDVGVEEDERRRLSRFASFVAHELRNPLAVAKARMELARRDPDLGAKAGTHAARALESVEAAIGILERLELFSRAGTGGVEASPEPFELGRAVESAVERLRTRGSEREVRVGGPMDIRVIGDRHLAEQALTNLLINAERYSEPGASIAVEITADDPVVLRVIDAGPGVPDEVAERLFRDRVDAGRGLGLGLYLVHVTMEAIGGSIALEQRRPQAIFALRWPRAEGRRA